MIQVRGGQHSIRAHRVLMEWEVYSVKGFLTGKMSEGWCTHCRLAGCTLTLPVSLPDVTTCDPTNSHKWTLTSISAGWQLAYHRYSVIHVQQDTTKILVLFSEWNYSVFHSFVFISVRTSETTTVFYSAGEEKLCDPFYKNSQWTNIIVINCNWTKYLAPDIT